MTKEEEKTFKIKRNELKNKKRTQQKREALQKLVEEMRDGQSGPPSPASAPPASQTPQGETSVVSKVIRPPKSRKPVSLAPPKLKLKPKPKIDEE